MTVEIVLQDRVRDVALRLQLIQDVAGVAVLAPAAWARVQTSQPLHVGLGLLEVGVIGAAVLSGVRELRGSSGHEKVDWTNLFMAGVLLLEWGVQLMGGGKLISPALLTALTALVLAALPRLRVRRYARRRMTLDDGGITVRLSLLRRLRVAWSDVQAIVDGPTRVSFVLHDGAKRRLGLRRYGNSDEIRAAIADAASRVGVKHVAGGLEGPKR